MPNCIVPGCTSGYASNPEKSHFFTVPKNPEAVELWSKAVKRKDVKPKQAVCQNHFRREEILWQRQLLGADGTVLGVSHLKIPRLARGAVPSIFPWVELIEPFNASKPIPETHVDNSPRDQVENTDKHPAAEQVVLTPPPKRQKTFEDNKENVNPPPEPLQPQNQNTPDHQDNDAQQAVDSAVKGGNLTSIPLTFEQLLKAEINRPPGWMAQKTVTAALPAGNSPKMIVLCTLNCVQVNGDYVPYVLKSVTVKDDLSISISALGSHVDMREFNLPSSITDTAELEEVLRKIHGLNICKGSTGSLVDEHISIVNCSTVHKDGTRTWRHIQCPLFLSRVMICKYCRNVKKTLATKLRRWKTGNVKERRYSALNSTEKMIRLRENLRAAEASVVKTEKKYKSLEAKLRISKVRIAHRTNPEGEVKRGNFISKPSPSFASKN